jgi:hypothetical protein
MSWERVRDTWGELNPQEFLTEQNDIYENESVFIDTPDFDPYEII